MRYVLLGFIVVLGACHEPVAPAENADRPEKTTEAKTGGPEQRPPVIDMHMHADLPPVPIPAGAPSICRPAPCEGEGRATDDDAATLDDTLAAMEEYNIVKAYVSGRDPAILRTWSAAAPERFIRAPFILMPGKPDVATVREGLKAGEFAGIGEIATQLMGIPPNDERLEPYFALAEDQDVPLLIHTLGIGPEMPTFRVAAGNPLLLEDVLVRHPKLRIFVENAGYPFHAEMIAMMSQYPHLYADVSTITWVVPRTAFYDHLEALIRAGLGKRIMFGSDQMRWPDRIGVGIEAIEEAPFLTEQQKRDILYNNAARFLRLNEEQSG